MSHPTASQQPVISNTPTAADISLETILRDVAGGQGQFLAVLDQFGESGYRAASRLPEWSRADVMAHVTVLAERFLVQLESAREGRLVPVYEGGAAQREAMIAAAAEADFDAARERFSQACAALNAAWPVGDGWQARVAFRNGVVRDVLLAWWREVRIHTYDLNVHFDDSLWSPHFHAHVWAFLRECVPNEPIKLRGTLPAVHATWPDHDAPDETYTRISGQALHVTLWLAGRTPPMWPLATRAGKPVSLPPVSEWPSALKPTA